MQFPFFLCEIVQEKMHSMAKSEYTFFFRENEHFMTNLALSANGRSGFAVQCKTIFRSMSEESEDKAILHRLADLIYTILVMAIVVVVIITGSFKGLEL